MLDKSDNSMDLAQLPSVPPLVRVAASNQSSGPCSMAPEDPRVKRIQWSVTNGLEIISMPGDFSALGFETSDELTEDCDLMIKQQQVLNMLGESQTVMLFNEFRKAIQLGNNPPTIELKFSIHDKVFWVEQETLIQNGANGEHRIFSYWYDATRRKLAEGKTQILEQVFDSIPSWVFLKNTSHQYELVNNSYASVYGVSPEQCIGKNSIELGVPEEIAKGDPAQGIRGFWADDREVFESGEPKDILCEPIIIDGEQRYLQTRKTPIKDLETGQQLLVGFCHDITYLKEIEARVRIELRHNKTLNAVNKILRSVDNPHQSVNSIRQLITKTIRCAKVQIQLRSSSRPEGKTNSGLYIHSTPVEHDGIAIAYLNTWHDKADSLNADDKALLSAVSERLAIAFHRQELLAEIKHQANYDSLTKLPNRHNILKQIDQAIRMSKQNDQRCSVVILDLDGFKTINDTFGHHIGDQLLLAVADRLKGISQPFETLARLGGDEFAILLTNLESQDCSKGRAEAYLAALQDSFEVGGRELFVGGSLGISSFPEDSNNRDSMMRHADWAMYAAKSEGRNRCQPFTAQIAKQTQHRLGLENDLRNEIHECRNLFLLFQPKIELSTLQVTGVEALVRWSHPQHGLVSPSEFIPIAEETGLIIQLGQWIMREACKTVATWNQQLEQKIQLSLNITPPELEQRGLSQRIFQTLAETGLEPKYLDLEVTETFVMKRFDEVSRCLDELRKQGIKVSVDDFGTGYSCMSYLHRLPVDCLKIDRSFIELLDFDCQKEAAQRTSITQTIVTLAKSMGLKTVAEGIESENQYHHLLNLGVDTGQGYLFSQPLPESEALQFVFASIQARSASE